MALVTLRQDIMVKTCAKPAIYSSLQHNRIAIITDVMYFHFSVWIWHLVCVWMFLFFVCVSMLAVFP